MQKLLSRRFRLCAEALVDAQATYTKAVFAATTEIGKTVADAFIAAFPKQEASKK